MSDLLTKNPCIDVCKFDSNNLCLGCGRTKHEKKTWKKLDDHEKHAIWQRILETHTPKKKKAAKKLKKKRKKAETQAAALPDPGAE